MKRIISAVIVLMLAFSCCAEGLLPGFTAVYGVDMPSLTAVTEKAADLKEQLPDGGSRVTYYGIEEAQFDAFSDYLDTFGCELLDYSYEGSALTCVVGRANASFTIAFDNEKGVCVLTYPNGTNEEDEDKIVSEAQEKRLARWKTGSYIEFGTYPQTAGVKDNTPIEWLVLDVQDDKALLISKYALDCVQYNTKYTDVTWETCTLRTWINGTFYDRAFTATEKGNIIKTTVTADRNPKYDTNPGIDVQDNVFLLSIVEANKYFKDNNARMCAPTAYAVKNGAYQNASYTVDGTGACRWWLRSPGSRSSCAALVDSVGVVNSSGLDVSRSNDCVRPCVWVRLF